MLFAIWADAGNPHSEGFADRDSHSTVFPAIPYTHSRATGHNATVYAAVWSSDGTYIASGGEDKTQQVWQAVEPPGI